MVFVGDLILFHARKPFELSSNRLVHRALTACLWNFLAPWKWIMAHISCLDALRIWRPLTCLCRHVAARRLRYRDLGDLTSVSLLGGTRVTFATLCSSSSGLASCSSCRWYSAICIRSSRRARAMFKVWRICVSTSCTAPTHELISRRACMLLSRASHRGEMRSIVFKHVPL